MSARLTAKKDLPTALVAKQLPAGLADMRTVLRLLPPGEWNDEAARLAEYVAAIRANGDRRRERLPDVQPQDGDARGVRQLH
eukprot:7376189-Prymnesium_polylepis.1